MTTTTPQKSGSGILARGLGAFFHTRETAILLAVILLVAATTVKNPSFIFSADGWRDLLLTPAMLVIVAVGQAIVIVSRNYDLSVGSVLGLTAYLAGRLFIDVPGIPIILVILATIAFGGLLGLVNGALVAFARVPSLVITLGMLYAYRGINVLWAGSNRINASDLPSAFLAMGTGDILSIPILTIVALAVLVVAAWYMKNLRGGRELYAMGSDPDAAELYGLRVTRRVLLAFVTSGALAGLAGILFAARYGTVNSQAGTGLELDSIAAVVIGGVAIFGGSGTVWGAALGAVLLVTINRSLPIVGVPDFWQRAVVGALIIGAIVFDRILSLRRSRRLQQTGGGAL